MSSHLKLRGSTYYAQKRVPDDVRQAVGAQMLEKSLRTGDKAKANRAKLAVLAEWQEWFDSIRRGGDAAVRTPAELQQYANKLREEVATGRLRHMAAEECSGFLPARSGSEADLCSFTLHDEHITGNGSRP